MNLFLGLRMLNNLRGLLWLLVALLFWMAMALANVLLAVVDDVCGWISRWFDALYGDW
jgi:hypothetical protein